MGMFIYLIYERPFCGVSLPFPPRAHAPLTRVSLDLFFFL